MRVYLDYNASAKTRPQVIEAVVKAMQVGANASSVHGPGRIARAIIEDAREATATLVGAVAGQVTFTSGGTEANNLAIHSARAAAVERLIVLSTEHDSVLAAAQASALPVLSWPVDQHGLADLAWFESALKQDGRAMVVEAVAALTGAAGAWLHVDAVQSAGKMVHDISSLGADTIALSGHKIGGPQGVGALVASPLVDLVRQVHGGGHERGRRAGTENLPGIAGFGAAAMVANPEALGVQVDWRDVVAARLKAAGAVVTGEAAPRLPQTLSIAMPGFSSQTQVMALDLAGYAVSAGAACSSGKVTGSRVIKAMGLDAYANSSLRISGGWDTKESDWQGFATAWLDAYSRVSRKVA